MGEQYTQEHAIPLIASSEELIREDTLAELALSNLNEKSFLEDLAMEEFVDAGHMPEKVTKKMIRGRVGDTASDVKQMVLAHELPGSKTTMTDYLEEFVLY